MGYSVNDVSRMVVDSPHDLLLAEIFPSSNRQVIVTPSSPISNIGVFISDWHPSWQIGWSWTVCDLNTQLGAHKNLETVISTKKSVSSWCHFDKLLSIFHCPTGVEEPYAPPNNSHNILVLCRSRGEMLTSVSGILFRKTFLLRYALSRF